MLSPKLSTRDIDITDANFGKDVFPLAKARQMCGKRVADLL
jgi:hypothetical protein